MAWGIPDVPDIPDIPEIPKIPELPSAPKGEGGNEINDAIKQVDELSAKLNDAETSIYGMLDKVKSSIPKVSIKLPKLNPDLFGPAPAGTVAEKTPLLASTSNPDLSAKGAQTEAKKKAAAMKAKAAAAAQKAEDAKAEMEEQAKEQMAKQGGMVKKFAGQGAAGLVSVGLAVGIATVQLGPLVGPMLAAMTSVVVNFMGLAAMWKGKADGIFGIVNGVFAKMTGKVVDVLDTVDEMILGPLDDLSERIDDMIEEQQPVVDNMKKFESGMKAVDPTFDLPEPADLKKPLDGCEAMIDEFVGKAKKEVPEKLDDAVQSTFMGKIATDSATFNRYVVFMPLGAVLAVNLLLAAVQVYVTFILKPAEAAAGSHHEHHAERHLRGSHEHEHEAHHHKGAAPSEMDKIEHMVPPQFRSMDLMPYLQPVLVQILLAVLQAVLAMMMSQGPRICKMINDAVENLQEKLNERVNARIKGAIDRVFGQAFSEVKEKGDLFFPKFKDSTKKLKQAMEMAAKAQALAGGAQAAAAAVGGIV